jgi:D-glycero-alpha-D-manno-heptose 1-phosphate guanylyltransferase
MNVEHREARMSLGHRQLSQVTAVILAGGFGTRLRPIVSDRPKVLASVAGQPFLTFLLDQLAAAGVKRVILCTGYRSDQVWRQYGRAYGTMTVSYSQEREPLGTAGALRQALPLILSDPVLVLNGDSFCDVDLDTFLASHLERGAEGSLVLSRSRSADRFGRVLIGAEGQILRFDEKVAPPPAEDSAPSGAALAVDAEATWTKSGWINAGIYLLSGRLVAGIPGDRAVSLEREMIPTWIDDGLYGFPATGRFIDIGTPDSYYDAQALLGDLA